MKIKYLLIVFLTLFIFCKNKKMTNDNVIKESLATNDLIMAFNLKEIDVSKIEINGLKLGCSEEEFIKINGLPETISIEVDEILNLEMRVFKYSKSNFYFVKNKLESFNILNDSFRIKVIKDVIKIGDSLNYDKESFRLKFKNFDQYINFDFNNNKLIEVYTWEPS